MHSGSKSGRFGVLLVILELSGTAGAQTSIVRVDPSLPMDGGGQNWAFACNRLETALSLVGTGGEIWLAAGTYVPAHGSEPGNYTSATFVLNRGVKLYGGFPPGGGDGTFQARQPELYATVFSGDILGNDTDAPATLTDNCYHVVSINSDGGLIDGVTIRSGVSPDDDYTGGGAVIATLPNFTFRNCHFTHNRGNGGGAIRLYGTETNFVGCRFTHNWSKWGSCVSSYTGNVNFSNCEFAHNEAEFDGACLQLGRGTHWLSNCTFYDNRGNAGTALVLYYSDTMLVNCTAVNNSAAYRGSIIWLHTDSALTVANSILWNYVDTLPPIYIEPGNTLTIHHSCLKGGEAKIEQPDGAFLEWGLGNRDADPMFADTDLRLSLESPCLDAGDATALPPDLLDLDADGNLTEPLPLDLAYLPRAAIGTPEATVPIVDMGAYEYQGDCNGNQLLDAVDIENGTSPDCDHNGIPDECDPDSDGDGLVDGCDNCPNVSNADQANSDEDALGDACDNCPYLTNPDQANLDHDNFGDACDDDMDNDGWINTQDNCPREANPGQEDTDGDTIGDACDACAETIPGMAVDATGCPADFLGDMDRDGDVDQSDFGAFQLCLSGTGNLQLDPSCARARLDADDSDVDAADLEIFRRCLTAANTAADPSCIRKP